MGTRFYSSPAPSNSKPRDPSHPQAFPVNLPLLQATPSWMPDPHVVLGPELKVQHSPSPGPAIVPSYLREKWMVTPTSQTSTQMSLGESLVGQRGWS